MVRGFQAFGYGDEDWAFGFRGLGLGVWGLGS